MRHSGIKQWSLKVHRVTTQTSHLEQLDTRVIIDYSDDRPGLIT